MFFKKKKKFIYKVKKSCICGNDDYGMSYAMGGVFICKNCGLIYKIPTEDFPVNDPIAEYVEE